MERRGATKDSDLEMAETRGRLSHLVGKEKVSSAIQKEWESAYKVRTYSISKSRLATGKADFFVLIGPGQSVQGVKFVSGAEELKPAAKAIEGIHFNQPFPDDAPTVVARRGILSCSKLTPKCDVVLYTLDMVRSVE